MKVPIIHTIDAREYGFLEGMSKHYKWSPSQTYMQINLLAAATIDVLEKKKISYAGLKNALIPHADRKEIAFVFNSREGLSDLYGRDVFAALIPLLDKKTANSILIGDYIGEPRHSAFLKELLFTYLIAHREIKYVHHGLFFIVYLNNLSEKNFQDIHEGLQKLSAYNGYFDLTYASPIKTVLSTILVRAFLKTKTTIINPTEADEDVNMTSYPFEKFGYRVIGIDDMTYGVYLSYKIEREVFPGYEVDQLFSLNAITDEVKDLSELTPTLDERKLEYLLQKKFGTLSLAGITNLTTAQIVDIIKKRIKQNYIFSLEFLPEYETMKFSTLMELPRIDSGLPIKLTAGFAYEPKNNLFRLVTLF